MKIRRVSLMVVLTRSCCYGLAAIALGLAFSTLISGMRPTEWPIVVAGLTMSCFATYVFGLVVGTNHGLNLASSISSMWRLGYMRAYYFIAYGFYPNLEQLEHFYSQSTELDERWKQDEETFKNGGFPK